MRKFLSERNIAGALFIVALFVLYLAKQDTYAVEKFFDEKISAEDLTQGPAQTASSTDTSGKLLPRAAGVQ